MNACFWMLDKELYNQKEKKEAARKLPPFFILLLQVTGPMPG